jgi:ABC-2 type transport system permease protein
MSAAVRAELLKVRTGRGAIGLVGLAVALTALIAGLESATAGSHSPMAVPSLATRAGLRDALTSTGFALLVSVVLGTTISSSEFRLKTVTGTFLDQPRRGRVLVAKVVAALPVGALVGLAGAATASAIGLGFAAARGYAVALPASTIVRFGVGAVAGSALLAGVGAGVGMWVRHQVGAIVAVFTWGFVVEEIVGGVLKEVAPFLPYTAAAMTAGVVSGGGMPQVPRGIVPLPFGIVVVLLAGVAAAMALAAAVTSLRKDVT